MIELKHACNSVAEDCKKSTMATYKLRQRGTKTVCTLCSKNAAMGKPQHAPAETEKEQK